MKSIIQWFMATNAKGSSPRRNGAILLGVMIAVFAGLAGRLFDLQVMQHEHYVNEQKKISTRTVLLPGVRGSIVTEDGVALAQTTFSGASIVVNPRAVPASQRGVLSHRLAELLGRDDAFADNLHQELYNRRNKYFYSVARKVTPDVADEVRQASARGELPGIELRNIETREYPLGDFAAHIVGFVGRDMNGLEGAERALNQWLEAKPGKRVIHVDALGQGMEGVDDEVIQPRNGARVELTINAGVQSIVEDELAKCVEKWDPVTVSVIVMETHTGAILGLANYPSFNPNNPGSDASARKNISITDPFEPGSMFKPLIVCSAYEKGILTPDSEVEYTPKIRIPGRRKLVTDEGHEINSKYLHRVGNKDYVDVPTALVKSSNTVMTRIGLRLGIDQLYDSITRYGFGRYTGFDLGGRAFGESAGLVFPKERWTVPSSIPSVSIGYEVQVTPMQMLNCFNALANGGKVWKPWVVRRVVGPDDKLIYEGKPHPLLDSGLNEHVTRTQMNETLKRVVTQGTATNAKLKQYQIAGKTGTANKVKNGTYSSDKVCSFVGYAPADNPVISVIVVVNEARAKNKNKWGYRIRHYGGTVAAPTMAQVVLRSLKHLGVPEDSPVEVKKD